MLLWQCDDDVGDVAVADAVADVRLPIHEKTLDDDCDTMRIRMHAAMIYDL